MLEIRVYIDERGRRPFVEWFEGLDIVGAARVNRATVRLGQGHLSNVKGVGFGVFEYKIDFGPGYRVYFGRDGEQLVILVGGGTKQRQGRDIVAAQECWAEYKRMKKREIQ